MSQQIFLSKVYWKVKINPKTWTMSWNKTKCKSYVLLKIFSCSHIRDVDDVDANSRRHQCATKRSGETNKTSFLRFNYRKLKTPSIAIIIKPK